MLGRPAAARNRYTDWLFNSNCSTLSTADSKKSYQQQWLGSLYLKYKVGLACVARLWRPSSSTLAVLVLVLARTGTVLNEPVAASSALQLVRNSMPVHHSCLARCVHMGRALLGVEFRAYVVPVELVYNAVVHPYLRSASLWCVYGVAVRRYAVCLRVFRKCLCGCLSLLGLRQPFPTRLGSMLGSCRALTAAARR